MKDYCNSRPKFKWLILLLAVFTLLVANGAVAAPESTALPEDELFLVRYTPGAKTTVAAEVVSLGGAIRHQFDYILVLAVRLSSDAASVLAGHPAVTAVEVDPIYHPLGQTVPYGIEMVQAIDTWDADRDGVIDAGAPTGSGIRVCVVDTGIYETHEDLGGGGVKIITGRSWVAEEWNLDLHGHGTHVAGTIAAMHNNVGVVGVSPGQVELIIARVFNDAGDGQASSTILEAANWCAGESANIISMSLGGLIGTLADGYQVLYDRGILVVAAAGNNGAPVQSYPASFPSVVSVGAVDSTGTVADFSNFPLTGEVELAAPGVGVLSTYPFENSVAVNGGPKYNANSIVNADPPGTYSGSLADGGDCNTLPAPGAYTGQVVLCQRGGTPFRVKIDNAAAGGATAAVIYNEVPGNFRGTYGDPCCASIPAVSLSQADGQDALNYLGQNVTITVELESVAGYAELSGTSMATPHASGVAAVLWSACPTLTNDQIRSHMAVFTKESESDLVPGRDPFYGYGIPQLKDAVDGLFDGIDQYDPANPNSDGQNPANVECDGNGEPTGGGKSTGAGWLEANDGKKINFNFRVEGDPDGGDGELKLNDKAAGVQIHLSQVTFVGDVSGDCGSVSAGNNALAFHGTGTFNGNNSATFRVCAEDNGSPGRGNDRFYLACETGCDYNTGARTPNDLLGGGNLQVERTGGGDDGGQPTATTMMLDPILLTEGVVGQVQLFTVTVYDQNQQAMANATVELAQTAGGSLVETLIALTDATGTAVFGVVNLNQVTEYVATSGQAQSNAIEVSPLISLP